MNIGAIETSYKGYRFRSRLEARWAVFFDALNIPWLYEHEGFESDGIRYLPDFYLPNSETWVEVKGSDKALFADAEKLTTILDYSSPLPGMWGSFDYDILEDPFKILHGLLILGDIPEPQNGTIVHPIIQHSSGLLKCSAEFWNQGLRRWGNVGCRINSSDPNHWSVKSTYIPTYHYNKKVVSAYAAARSARFEHGENRYAA